MILKPKYLVSLLPLLCLSCNWMHNKPEVNNIIQTFIFNQPNTNNCHAATIVEVMPDRLMAAWFGGSYEGAKDVSIYSSFYDGKTWSAPVCLVKPLVTTDDAFVKNAVFQGFTISSSTILWPHPERLASTDDVFVKPAVFQGYKISPSDTLPCWNPVLFKSQSNCLYLFYKVGKNPREWYGAMITSMDNGKTWSGPQYLPDGMLGPIKNKPIEITPGVILCGSSTESSENNQWRVHVELYNEATGAWKKIPVGNKKGFDVIQPTFLVHSDQTIQMLCRSKHDKLISCWSEDGGNNWNNMDSLDVVNSNSGIDALTIGNNSFLLVNNPLPQGADWYYGRNVLDVEYSTDGIHWGNLLDLENQPEGEFSYPAIIQTSDNKIHILYTFNRKYIKHVAFDLIAKTYL